MQYRRLLRMVSYAGQSPQMTKLKQDQFKSRWDCSPRPNLLMDTVVGTTDAAPDTLGGVGVHGTSHAVAEVGRKRVVPVGVQPDPGDGEGIA